MPRIPRFLAALLLGLAILLPVARAEDEAPTAEKTQRFEKEISEMRGLSFKEHVPVGVQTRAELREMILKSFDEEFPEEKAMLAEKILKKFGLVPEDMKLRSFMIDLLTEQIGGFYDPESKELYLIAPSDDEEPPAAMDRQQKMMEQMYGISMDDIVAVHELTHALGDQHFDLLTLPMEEAHNDDLVTAVKGLVEGEATFVMFDYLMQQMGMDLESLPNAERMLTQGSSASMVGGDKIGEAPLYIRESLVFPYMGGLRFVLHGKKAGGWDAINKAYETIPASTEQILHPEKFFGDPDMPVTVTLPALSRTLGKGWNELDHNVMGELGVDVLFRTFFPKAKTKKASGGWGGDSYVAYEGPDGEGVCLVWYITWDTPGDGREFFTAYKKLLATKYPKAKEIREEENLNIWETDGGVVLLDRREGEVLVVDGAPAAAIDKIQKRVWDNVKKEEVVKIARRQPTEAVAEKPPVEKPPVQETPTAAATQPGSFSWKTDSFRVTLDTPKCLESKRRDDGYEFACPEMDLVIRLLAPDREDGDIEDAVKIAQQRFGASMDDFEVVSMEEREVNGRDAVDLVFTGRAREVDGPLAVRVLVVQGKQRFYILVATCLKKDFPKANKRLSELYSSMKVKE